MPRYLALLRGINVSGKKIIKMEDFRGLMQSVGYGNVKTYIQSGNVIFDSTGDSKIKIAASIEALIEGHYGFDVTVFVLSAEELERVIDNNPFVTGREPEGQGSKTIYVAFLSGYPSENGLQKLREVPIGEDLIQVIDDVLYFKLNSKASESKMSNALIETKLKLKATIRNWNTTLKVHEMLAEE